MPSDLTQIVSIAAGGLLPQNQTLAHHQQVRPQVPTSQQQVSQITQIASAQTATKPSKNDKERGTQVPKRPEAGFASEDDRPDQQSLGSSKDTTRKLRAKA